MKRVPRVKGAAVVAAEVEGLAVAVDEAGMAVAVEEDVAVADRAAGVAEAATNLALRLLASALEYETRAGVTTSVVLLF
jgi:hypothetical protein